MNKITIQTMDIGEISKKSGLPPSTLRFYEEIGLIRSIGRHGLRRLFDSRILEHLEFIALGQLAGFSLEEIGAMFGADGRYQIDRKMLISKADGLDKKIQQLIAIRNGLQHAAECRAPSHTECPKFQRLLRAAGRNQVRNRTKGGSKS